MKKKRRSIIKDLHLDKPTSHGGWPNGHPGSYTDNSTPVNKQIANWLISMGLADDSRETARISEQVVRSMIRNIILTKIYR